MTIKRRDLLTGGAGIAAGMAAAGLSGPAQGQTNAIKWDREADVVVIGSGASGTTAAIVAREGGSSVILVEAESHTGGHAICSGGNVPLGGGTSVQKKWGIKDSPDLVFQDLTDWSVVESNGAADYRLNDREVIRAFADNCAATCEFLLAHGVVFVDKTPDKRGGNSVGNSIPREMHAAAMDWPLIQTGKPAAPDKRATMSTGNGLMQPLGAAAKKAGVEILLRHRMTAILRETPHSGPVLGIAVDNNGKTLNIRAHKAVIVGTGGSTSNVNFRRMFDPRLTEEYCGAAGQPWSTQDASGELAGMAIGASLWGLSNFAAEFGDGLTKAGSVGAQYVYVNLRWYPGSEVFSKARATGLHVGDWQDLVLVNMIGNRFYDETARQYSSANYGSMQPYNPRSWKNGSNLKFKPNGFLDAALAGIGDEHNGGGPIWAIFDADAVAREKWDPHPPNVDFAAGFFFTADTIEELAKKIEMKYQRVPMPPANLAATIARYNSFVDSGVD
ncbi:MAG: FAD-dependent oxidoreductase, partial [Xanthobacteraceae bacterium]